MPDCSICAVGAAAGFGGRAAACIPIATVCVDTAHGAAAQLLQGLNRDASYGDASNPRWCFGWHISGPSFTAAEQTSLVLCWVQPLGPERAGEAALPAQGHGASDTLPGPAGVHPAATGAQRADPPAHGAILPGTPLSDPRCIAALRQLLAAQPAAQQGACGACPCASPGPRGDPVGGIGTDHPGPGRLISAVGSPFGCLAPFHFLNSQVNGAIACAFPAPHSPTQQAAGSVRSLRATPALPTSGPASATARAPPGFGGDVGLSEGGRLGPVLYALDVHVFPGMEGALVTPWRHQEQQQRQKLTHAALQALELHSKCNGGPGTSCSAEASCGVATGRSSSSVVATAGSSAGGSSVDGTDASCCARCGGGCSCSRSAGPAAPCGGDRPLGLLCLPLCRRADGVQVPLAIAWPAVEAALLDTVDRLLHPHAAHGKPSASRPHAASSAAPAQPQLQLQPVSTCPARGGRHATAHIAGPSASRVDGQRSRQPAAELPGWAPHAVVLLRCNGSWATGVLVGDRAAGLLITTAHLFGPANAGSANGVGGASGAGAAADPEQARREWAHVVCWARVAWAGEEPGPTSGQQAAGSPRDAPSYRWLRARVLYVWGNHLDLAVLQLESPYGRTSLGAGAAAPPLALAAVREAARARQDEEPSPFYASPPGTGVAAPRDSAAVPPTSTAGPAGGGACPRDIGTCQRNRLDDRESDDGAGEYGSGTPVWAVGHSLIGPSAEWPPLVSHGCVARVLRRRCGRPTMVIATTTTHAGGSGGALLDARGRLVGLVTSNARHAGGTTLPNMAFCIAAEELEPVLSWAAARGGSTSSSTTAGSGCGGGSAADAARRAASRPPPEQRKPAPTLADLAACDAYDDDADRIWRLQMPALGPALAAQAASVTDDTPAPVATAVPLPSSRL